MAKHLSSSEIRRLFLDYFEKLGHTVLPSSSLVPGNDATLLFTNAGMVQFKDVFLGLDKRPYTRAATSQRCVRAGGKHNDLDQVGYTARHHTFFEMLGNFSFGDYFKQDAIFYAWRFLTDVLELPKERLWVTVYKDDAEAEKIWLNEVGIDANRFSRCGEKDNFWSMGDTGPCGPCTEIFYDHGPDIPGGPPGSPEEDADRYIEIWNLVFMQYDRSATGELTPLPKPSVDTGMGLERLSAVLQGVHNNYDTDLFIPIIKVAAALAKISDLTNTSLRVLADHIRSCAFLIVDGVVPSNEGRGYVLRRIIRRALRHGNKLEIAGPFFYKLLAPLVDVMGSAYPELVKMQKQIEHMLTQEEEQFAKTLEQGMKIFEQEISQMPSSVISGKVIFKLYDTYGFPPDLTADIAREKELQLDMIGFEIEMARQRALSQSAGKFNVDYHEHLALEEVSEFLGYEALEKPCRVLKIIENAQITNEIHAPCEAQIILDATPFYAESGGQVGDQGILRAENCEFKVEDTQKRGKAVVHIGKLLRGSLKSGLEVLAGVDKARRQATVLNHSATHLLHSALRVVLGEHVEQKGSLVQPDKLRFDFSHGAPLTPEQISQVESLVNQYIRANVHVETHVMPVEEALKQGAMALFGEKYEAHVRVLRMGEFSTELCGGTHAVRTGDIGLFKITSQDSIAAGIRRIEAVTGATAFAWVLQMTSYLTDIAQQLRIAAELAPEKIGQLLEKNRALEKELEQLRGKLAKNSISDILVQAHDHKGVRIVVNEIQGADIKVLRELLDVIRNQLQSCVAVLASIQNGKVILIAGVSKDLQSKIHAGELIKEVATRVGGQGGGRSDIAQAGGSSPEALPEALIFAREWVVKRL